MVLWCMKLHVRRRVEEGALLHNAPYFRSLLSPRPCQLLVCQRLQQKERKSMNLAAALLVISTH